MQPTQVLNVTREDEVLAVSLELASKEWKLGLDDGKRNAPRVVRAKAESPEGRVSEVVGLIEKTRRQWALGAEVRVVVVYEAGQDGFWLQRALERQGYETRVVDPASIPVERRARRAKTDRLDAMLLVRALRGWLRGEADRMRVVRVPEVAVEGRRHLMRERGQLQKEIGQHRDRIGKILRTVGNWQGRESDLAQRLERGEVRGFGGEELALALRERLERECARLQLVEQQLKVLEQTIPERLPESEQKRLLQLMQLKAVGIVGGERLLLELFWRDFGNRRDVGACVGLVPQPYDSGESRVDQGISKAGNRRVRALLIEMAWMWLRWQPQSELTQWFLQRTKGSGPNKRSKRIAIVAVARKLAILLWRYLKNGTLPKGVALKPVPARLPGVPA